MINLSTLEFVFPSRDLRIDSIVPPLCEIVAVMFVFDNLEWIGLGFDV